MEKQMEELKQQLKQQEKLASLGLLSAGIAHEIQNPLNFVINFSKMSNKLLSDLTEIVEDNEDKLSEDDREEVEDIVADLKENMAKIVEHGERAISIIQASFLFPEERITSLYLRIYVISSKNTFGCLTMPCVPTTRVSILPSVRTIRKDFPR
jgi:signal transduction histidine kinase